MRRRAKFEIISLITLGMMGAGGASVGALSYQSNVGVGFTFNPTLTVSLSSGDLTIPGLTLDSTGVSNDITVSVSTNAAYGYTLSATVGNNSTYNSDNLINSLDSSKVFSNIATDANLANLGGTSDTNIWGYSYKDNTVTTPAWSNYNGLPLYSATGTTLIDTNSAATDGSADFRIAAKTSSTQASGEYNNVINFVAVSKVGVVSLLDALVASNATQQNGYYTMQGMTPAICSASAVGSSAQLLDVRDNKLYWVAKLADGNCWMTQNLDHDIVSTTDFYNSTNTDLPSGVTWTGTATRTVNDTTWSGSAIFPESYNPGNICWNGTPLSGITESCSQISGHYHLGNFYNWTAAIAMSNSSAYEGPAWPEDKVSCEASGGVWYEEDELCEDPNLDYEDVGQSICPAGWRLPIAGDSLDNPNSKSFMRLVSAYGWDSETWALENLYMWESPLYFLLGGLWNGTLRDVGHGGYYWSSVASESGYAYDLNVDYDGFVEPGSGSGGYVRSSGAFVRCVAR